MNTENQSTENSTFEAQYKDLVHKIVQVRKDAGFTQEFVSQLCNIERRKIIEFEKANKIDINTLIAISKNFSIELELKFNIN
jgi:transcriptional regulator with XRE-family HTH domain